MAALTNCPDCAKQISARAEACPHCGAPIRRRQSASGLLSAMILAGLVGWALYWFLSRY